MHFLWINDVHDDDDKLHKVQKSANIKTATEELLRKHWSIVHARNHYDIKTTFQRLNSACKYHDLTAEKTKRGRVVRRICFCNCQSHPEPYLALYQRMTWLVLVTIALYILAAEAEKSNTYRAYTCKLLANPLPWTPSLHTACALPSDQESLCTSASQNRSF